MSKDRKPLNPHISKPHLAPTSVFPRTRQTCAKMIEIQKIYLQKIHGLHELGSHRDYNDTLRGSELGPHWVLGQKIQTLVPWDQKNWLKNVFTQS